MRNYKIKFALNGVMTETIICASSPLNARKLLEAQYVGKIVYYSVTAV